MEMNKKGEMPDELNIAPQVKKTLERKEPDFENVVGQDSLTRFDKKKSQNKGNNRNRKFKKPNNNANKPPRQNPNRK